MQQVQIAGVKTSQEMATVAGLARIIWTAHYVPIIGSEQVEYMLARYQTTEAIRKQIEEEGFSYFLISHSDQAIGYIGITIRNKELFLSKLYVLASERGKGAGRSAIGFLLSLGRKKQLEYMTLTVNKYNLVTIKAYEKMGFEKYGEVVSDIGSGYVMDDYLMRLPIPS